MRSFLYKTIAFWITLVPLNLQSQTTEFRTRYIEQYKNLALQLMIESGVPASIILAQATLESNDGRSKLATNANNHFGIKCSNWNGDTFYQDDDKKNECFRKYKTVEESYRDHSYFLTSRSRYSHLFKIDKDNYKAWAQGLQEAGYATNPNYANLLIKVIEDNKLYELNKADKTNIKEGRVLSSDDLPSNEKVEKSSTLITIERSIFKNNDVSYIYASAGDTYSSIAKEYNLFKREILSFNDLKVEQDLIAGDVVYIERKKNHSSSISSHKLKSDEDLHYIAQKYGIRLKSLLKINKLKTEFDINEDLLIKLK